MLVSTDKVDAILLGNASDIVKVTDWSGDGKRDFKTFVFKLDNKFYQGEVVRTITKTDDSMDKNKKITEKGQVTVTYSHEENDGVEVYEVSPHAVKVCGKRIIQYRRK